MEGPAFTHNVSMIFNRVYQEEQLKSLKKRLMSDQNNVLATIVSERLKNNFGLRAMPSLDEVLPFIYFDDSGSTHFTLIYTSSLLSPFPLICSHYFGRHIMNLQREVYQLLYTNTLNISDSDSSSDGESQEDQTPAILSYANGVARDRLFQQTSASQAVTSSSRESGVQAEEDGEQCLRESSPSYSPSSLVSLEPENGNIRTGKQQQVLPHDSSESRADVGTQPAGSYDARDLQTDGKSPATHASSKEQISKKHKCDRCSKSFSVRSHLDSHRVTHTGEKRYKCSRCGNRFTQSSSLRNHMIAIHTRNFPHVCNICKPSKGFLLPSQLRKHREQVHRSVDA